MKTFAEWMAIAITAAKAARAIHQKAIGESREMTSDELADYQAKFKEATKAQEAATKAKASEDAAALLDQIANSTLPPLKAGTPGANGQPMLLGGFGEVFTKSDPYLRFAQQFPAGVGVKDTPISIGHVKVGTMQEWFRHRKAAASLLVSDIAEIQNIRMPMVDQVVRPPLTILDLISRGTTGGNFEYLQVIGVNRNAKIVPEASAVDDDDALRPTSDMSTQLADAKVYSYADGYDVTNTLLADAPAFGSYMNTELQYSLDSVVEDKLVSGAGSNGEPKGLEHTTGVQEQEYTNSGTLAKIEAIRKAITKITKIGGQVSAVVMSPEDDEEIDLARDLNDRFYGAGPFGTGPQTIWGRPRAVSQKIEQNTFWVGEWSQMALLDREGLSILAFNQHKDYAQRGLTYVKGELRAAQVIWKPIRFCRVGTGS